MLKFQPTYKLLHDPGPAKARSLRVTRQHAGASVSNTHDVVPPPVLLEVPDDQFHHMSAVMMPDAQADELPPAQFQEDKEYMRAYERSNPPAYAQFRAAGAGRAGPIPRAGGLGALAAVYDFLEANPAYKLLVAGHADTSGDDAFNYTISEERARNVLALLTGDKAAWVKLAEARHSPRDIPRILNCFSRQWGWQCFCGDPDTVTPAQQKQAVAGFQHEFNLEFGQKLKVDGIVGSATWGAIFDVYQEDISLYLDTTRDQLPSVRSKLRFVDGGHRYISCGEKYPIEQPRRDNFRSKENRRVELLFFHQNYLPKLSCHASTGAYCTRACKPSSCNVYGPGHGRFVHIRPDGLRKRRPKPRTPHFEVVETSFDLQKVDDNPDENYEGKMERMPVDREDPWGFLEPFHFLEPEDDSDEVDFEIDDDLDHRGPF